MAYRLLLGILLAAAAIALSGCGASSPAEKPFVVPPGAVTIKTLPPLLTLRGEGVPFQGKTELAQKIAGRAAAEIVVVAFGASGENANKSTLRIVWEDGAVDTIPAGTRDLVLDPRRRAKSITVLGYCFHEQRIFKDVAKKGTLNWEIRYSPVE